MQSWGSLMLRTTLTYAFGKKQFVFSRLSSRQLCREEKSMKLQVHKEIFIIYILKIVFITIFKTCRWKTKCGFANIDFMPSHIEFPHLCSKAIYVHILVENCLATLQCVDRHLNPFTTLHYPITTSLKWFRDGWNFKKCLRLVVLARPRAQECGQFLPLSSSWVGTRKEEWIAVRWNFVLVVDLSPVLFRN